MKEGVYCFCRSWEPQKGLFIVVWTQKGLLLECGCLSWDSAELYSTNVKSDCSLEKNKKKGKNKETFGKKRK